MFKSRRDTPVQESAHEIQSGMWVYEKDAPLQPMCVGRILGFGMCEVIYGKYKPYQVYKRRIATLRPLKKVEMHMVDNPKSHEIQQSIMQSLNLA